MSYVGPNTLKHFVQKYFGDPDNIKGLGDGTVTSAIKAVSTKANTNATNISTVQGKANTNANNISSLTTKVNGHTDSISQINTDLSAIKNNTRKKILLLGDSYLTGYGLTSPNTQNYGYLLKNMLTGNGKTIDYKGTIGAGFSTTLENNFYRILQTYGSNLSNYDLIIFCGGFNDAQNSGKNWQSIATGIGQCADYIKQRGNAAMFSMFVGLGSGFGYSANAANAYSVYASNTKIGYIYGSESVLHDYRSDYIADTIHPSITGQQKLARAVYSAIFSGSCSNGGYVLLNNGSFSVLECLAGNVVYTKFLGSYTKTWKGQTGNTLLDFGALPIGYFKAGAESTMHNFTCILECDTALGKMWMPGHCSFGNIGGSIHLVVSPCITNPDQGALDVTKTTLTGATLTCPAIAC